MSNGYIFISYRRDDSAGYARAIYDQFVQHFSSQRVFIDVDAIEPGLPFDEAIEGAVAKCDILLAIIGRRWLDRQTDTTSRLNDPKDFVRLEIAAALSRNVRVIPVLLDGASMPTEEQLPEPLRALARRNAIEVSNSRFKSDVARLITAVSKALGRPASSTIPAPFGAISMLHLVIGLLAVGVLLLLIYVGFREGERKAPAESISEVKDEPGPSKTDKGPPSFIAREKEPNDQAPEANSVAVGTKIRGEITPNEDRDFFRFRTSNRTPSKTIVVLRKLSSTGFWGEVSIYDKNERQLKHDFETADQPVSLVFESTPSSFYFVSVKSNGQKGGPYELEVREE